MRYLLSFVLLLALAVPAYAGSQKTLQNAATVAATGSNISVDDRGAIGVSVTVSGTATVNFEGSADGGVTWSGLSCTNITSGTAAQSASATGQFQCAVAGLSHFRTPLAICTTCTVTVVATNSLGSLGNISTSSVSSLGTATAAAPALSEAAPASFSFDLAGNARVTLGTLLSGEDQTNNLIMTSGGHTRVIQLVGTGGVPSTASDATTSAAILPVGMKTFLGVITCTGTCVQTQNIRGSYTSTFSTTTSEPVCTITLNATTSDHAYCKTDANFSYWFVTTSATSGTTPLALLDVFY